MKEWTVMVYMAGDNNLSENMAYSLEDIRTVSGGIPVTSQEKVNLLAFFDSSSVTAPTHYIDFSDLGPNEDPYRHPIQREDLVHTKGKTIRDLREGENAASALSIMNFIHWCIKTRKREAKNYALIFSAHSFGFHGTSFLRDESSGTHLTLFRFRWALEQVKKRYFNDEKIAILGFDSCVMSMLEIGYELSEVAQTIVASEGSLPNSGWGYAPMLKEFVATFGSDLEDKNRKQFLRWIATPDYVKEAAKVFVKTFIDQQKKLALGGRSVDIAAWDLEKVASVVEKVNELAADFNEKLYLVDKIEKNALTDKDIFIFQHLKKAILQAHFDAQTYMREQCIDLKDFCQRLIIECKFLEKGENGAPFSEIIKKCKEVILAIDDCILLSGFSGDEYQFSNGISLYFPWTHLTYFLTDNRYRYLRFNRGPKNKNVSKPKGPGKEWNKFLHNYLTRVTLRLARKNRDENGNENISLMDSFNTKNPIWRKDNPLVSKGNRVWSKDNPLVSKDNPLVSKDNPLVSKDNPLVSKDNPLVSKGEIGEYLFYFSRFKNFQLRWDISGFSDEFKFDEKFE